MVLSLRPGKSLQDLKEHRVRGGQYYEAAKLEVERQQALLKEANQYPEDASVGA